MADAEASRRTAPGSVRKKASARKRRRLQVVAGLGGVLMLSVTLVALQDQIVFFYSPSELHEQSIEAGTSIRLGGLVKEGTWTRSGTSNMFVISDGAADVGAV